MSYDIPRRQLDDNALSRDVDPSRPMARRGTRTWRVPRANRPDSERDDGADDRTRDQVGHGVVDVVDGDPAADHALEVEAPVLPQVQHAGEVGADVGRAVVRALQ